MKWPLGIGVLCMVGPAYSQQWVDASLPHTAYTAYQLYKDVDNNTLYACGHMPYPGSFQDNMLCRYTDGSWECFGVFNDFIRTVVVYHDTLVAAGPFSEVDGQPMGHIAYYHNGVWQPFGDFEAPITRLKVLDGELYALGLFEDVDGDTTIAAVAKRSGNVWVGLPPIPEVSSGVPGGFDIAIYQDTLYVSGSFTLANGLRGIVRLVNGNFEPVPGAIYGSIASGGEMAIYHDELYLAGSIMESAGNVGHGIIRYDGSQWKPVGDGLQDIGNGNSGFVITLDLTVYDDKLWVCGGGFFYAGHVPARGLAYWDGEHWCNVGTPYLLDQPSNALEFYNDTLYVAYSGQVIAGDSVNCLIKWNAGPIYSDSCSAPLGIADALVNNAATTLHVYQQVDGNIVVLSGTSGTSDLRFFDGTGRLVFDKKVIAVRDQPLSVGVPQLADGVYIVQLSAHDRMQSAKLLLTR
jgi:hypothetical protein